ncbi:DUF1926 domain-containing protein [Methylacidiphilum caldifontis]|uniref:alpha-amylase/4-alpha-glucanotransferase domain-containing protein n=1 Tax=Methylacidiphilum caldifontis TaxID=2795386 RepID=UPI001A8F4534|nr:alpha-amylase/4-alpha-glucanotransferase domain-containing protein [Methylacidiphilum caldifontis]QSR89535.1 DUF1926 domain-containing protein [Methylacidiphilum caldifontis]
MVYLKQINILWIVHFHQPNGVFPETYKKFTQKATLPFLYSINNHPKVKLSLHFSGNYLVYLQNENKEVIDLLRKMVEDGQIELLGGGFYEPIFCFLSREDSLLQLQKLHQFIADHLGFSPKGAWLAESVWEPYFVELLAQSGYQYTILEDSLFENAGLLPAEIKHPFLTQFNRHSIYVFGYHSLFSKEIPFKEIKDIHPSFVQISHREGMQIVCIAQSGELYGFWPDTREQVYQKHRLEDWLHYLDENSSWIQTRFPSEFIDGYWPVISLPSGGRKELQPFCLPHRATLEFVSAQNDLKLRFDADRFLKFFKGGNWLTFLSKYPEANYIHKRMLQVSEKIRSLPRELQEDIYDSILASQGHTVYWHAYKDGLFGNYIRDNAFSHILNAEKMIRERAPQLFSPIENEDFDADKFPEIFLRSSRCSVCIKPLLGGSITEFNFLPTSYNLSNTLRRHPCFFPEPIPPDMYAEDWHQRTVFLDHFVPLSTSLYDFVSGSFLEYGDFVNQPYEIINTAETAKGYTVLLERKGGLYFTTNKFNFTISKEYTLTPSDELHLLYTITNEDNIPIELLFCCEINYSILSIDSPDRYILINGKKMTPGMAFEEEKVREWTIVDETRKVKWQWYLADGPLHLFHFPLYTLNYERGLFGKDYQGSTFEILKPFHLYPREKMELKIFSKFANS